MDTYTSTNQSLRPLLTIALTVAVAISTIASSSAGPQFRFDGLSVEQENIAHWAIDLYDQAGLELPQVRFFGTDDMGECEGRDGIAQRRGNTTEITLCTAEAGPVEELLIMHELAHAWDFGSLTDDRRDAFQELRGATSWLGRNVEWHDRAGEQAAEIIVWGLSDRPIRVARITDASCTSLSDGFYTLTGQEPLHGFTDYC